MQSEKKEESFSEFLRSPLRRKQWIHAICREEGKEFKIVDGTRVCLLHFRCEDRQKSFDGRTYVVADLHGQFLP